MADQTTPTAAEIAAATVEYQKQRDVLALLNDEYDDIEKSLTDIAVNVVKVAKSNKESTRQVSELKSIYNSLSKTARTLSSHTEDFSNGLLETKNVSKVLRDITRDEDRITRQISAARSAGNGLLVAALHEELAILDAERKSADLLKKQNELIDDATGLTGNLLKGLEKIPILGESINFGEINQSMRQAAGNSNVFAAGLKTAGKQLKEGFKDPLVQLALYSVVLKKIWDLNIDLDTVLTDQAKQLGISKEESQDLYNQAYAYSNTTKDSFVTAERITKANTELSKALGVSANLGTQNAEAAARFSHYYGLSAESGAKLVELGVEQGENGLDVLNKTAKTYALNRAQYGNTIAFSKVLDKVSNTSSDILIRFKGNAQALTAAVMNADRLGLSLEQVDKVGESLLNFESSIDNELKAELLTGKQINLEKAREYALSGDISKLTTEIAKQVGGIHEFEKMNVIQRKAYAEAFGMNVQEMSTMLRKQEFESKLSKDIKDNAEAKLKYAKDHNIELGDSLRSQYEQKSLADEQKEIMDKLKNILIKITSGPMKVLFHQMEKIMEFVSKILKYFGGLTGGGLGSALGASLIALPGLFMVFKALKGTRLNPMVVQDVTGVPRGGMGPTTPGYGGQGFGKDYNAMRQMGGSRMESWKAANQYNNGIGNRMALGAGLGIGGGLLMSAASGMEAGGAKTTVSTLGGAAMGASMGMMFGPWGAAIGGLVGGIGSLISSMEEDRKNKEAKDKAQAEAQANADKQTRELLENLAVRPIQLGMNADTLQKWSTNSQQYGANSSMA
jgi:hypothetical protein